MSDDSALSASRHPVAVDLFSRHTIARDLGAGVVVFLVALPLCLGIALASNAPMFSGLIAGVVGGLVVGAISGSQLMVSGPAAGLTAIVVSAIATLGSSRSRPTRWRRWPSSRAPRSAAI